jgi:hypothetical protein
MDKINIAPGRAAASTYSDEDMGDLCERAIMIGREPKSELIGVLAADRDGYMARAYMGAYVSGGPSCLVWIGRFNMFHFQGRPAPEEWR